MGVSIFLAVVVPIVYALERFHCIPRPFHLMALHIADVAL